MFPELKQALTLLIQFLELDRQKLAEQKLIREELTGIRLALQKRNDLFEELHFVADRPARK